MSKVVICDLLGKNCHETIFKDFWKGCLLSLKLKLKILLIGEITWSLAFLQNYDDAVVFW